MTVRLHLITRVEYVLDYPDTFIRLDLQHFELAAITDIDEGQVVVADVHGERHVHEKAPLHGVGSWCQHG